MSFGGWVLSNYSNLMLNMRSGLLPKDLTKDEIEILVKEHGKNWFEIMGYTEPEFEKPQ